MRIVIIGVGLIGGSIGMALRQKIGAEVWGVDRNPAVLQEAVTLGAIDEGDSLLSPAVKGADLYLVAVPVGQIAATIRELLPWLEPGAVVTDTGSTKVSVVREVEAILPPEVSFVGGHPMAGKETTGIRAADPHLLENAFYLLTPTSQSSPEAVNKVLTLVRGVGAIPHLLSPEEHDRLVAAVSHLPHTVAAALVNAVRDLSGGDPRYPALAAGGFRDTTRIASSDPSLWRDILLTNREAVLEALQSFQQSLQHLYYLLEKGDGEGLVNFLAQANHFRRSIPQHQKGLLQPIFDLFVQIPDRPGAISEVTGLLGSMGINIRDIEIIHVREPEAGSLRLGFADEDTRCKAATLLAGQGYLVGREEQQGCS